MNNLRTPLSSCKNLPPYFFMVHLLHRLYGVDAPGWLGSRVVSVLDSGADGPGFKSQSNLILSLIRSYVRANVGDLQYKLNANVHA